MARLYQGLDVQSDFGGRFPWKSKYVAVSGKNKIAYVDEGPRKAPLTFLCVHGNPTWGYLYREFVRRLSPTYRVVAADALGFGRSDKPTDPAAYSLEGHIRGLESVVKELDLRNVVLVVQDWGGPIGLGFATRHPERIAGIVVLNTWAFVSHDGGLKLPWLFEWLVTGKGSWKRVTKRNLFTELFLVKAQKLSKEAADPYRAPHPTPNERVGVARFPQMIPQIGDTEHESYATMKGIEDGLARLAEKPALIVWAKRDPAFRKRQLDRWQKELPNHEGPFLLDDAKHFLQESHSPQILAHVEPWAASLEKREAPRTTKARAGKG